MDSTQVLQIPSQLLLLSATSPSFVAHFALFAAFLLSWTIVGGKVLKKIFKLPTIAGQIIAGIIVGPSVVNVGSFSVFAEPITYFDTISGTLYSCATYDLLLFVIVLISSSLTVAYLLWMAGHETDVHDIASVGSVALMAGILGAL